jgi:hypothetical protein
MTDKAAARGNLPDGRHKIERSRTPAARAGQADPEASPRNTPARYAIRRRKRGPCPRNG